MIDRMNLRHSPQRNHLGADLRHKSKAPIQDGGMPHRLAVIAFSDRLLAP